MPEKIRLTQTPLDVLAAHMGIVARLRSPLIMCDCFNNFEGKNPKGGTLVLSGPDSIKQEILVIKKEAEVTAKENYYRLGLRISGWVEREEFDRTQQGSRFILEGSVSQDTIT